MAIKKTKQKTCMVGGPKGGGSSHYYTSTLDSAGIHAIFGYWTVNFQEGQIPSDPFLATAIYNNRNLLDHLPAETRAVSRKISEGVLGTRRRRRRDRDAEGVEGLGNGEGVSPSPAD